MPKVNGLNARQAMFVQEYLVDRYSPRSANQIGMENLTKSSIAFAIEVPMALPEAGAWRNG